MTHPETLTATVLPIIADEIARLEDLDRTETVGQRVRLRVDSDEVTLTTQHPDENSTPMDEWHGLVATIGLPSGVTPVAVAKWLAREDVSAALETLIDGMGSRWDGNNRVGTYTEEAKAALDLFRIGVLDTTDAFRWESGEIISEMDPDEFFWDSNDQIKAAAEEDAAVALVLEFLDEDGVTNSSSELDGPVYIGRATAESYARQTWRYGR